VSVLAVLLTAVNVGDRNMAMADLRAVSMATGFKRAQKLLASGDIVRDCGRVTTAHVAKTMDAVVRELSGVETRAVARSADE
jgi:uncharacterized protein (DUF1697 family)